MRDLVLCPNCGVGVIYESKDCPNHGAPNLEGILKQAREKPPPRERTPRAKSPPEAPTILKGLIEDMVTWTLPMLAVAVLSATEVSEDELRGQNREGTSRQARQIFAILAFWGLKKTYTAIGLYLHKSPTWVGLALGEAPAQPEDSEFWDLVQKVAAYRHPTS